MPIYKMEKSSSKKGFANKFGKSFSSLKSSMSKALQSHILPNENESQTIDSLPSNQQQFESKALQNQIDLLKEVLEEKELLIIDLRKTSHEEQLKFEKEKFQFKQKIEQLQNENMQLQKQLNMQ